ncbi:MAG: TIR domain-containing protein [Bacteroidota bacterium]
MTIFYSWQSDLPSDTNRKAISICIKNALLKIESESDLVINYDEATRGEPGSPEIPSTILNKISKADIFIADITTINSDEKGRKTPNPNVLIELGYAVAELGWSRIIMLYNIQYGSFPSDLPFDLDKRRVTNFKILDKTDNNGKGGLTSVLQAAISSIAAQNVPKPFAQKNLHPENIKRVKDITNIKKLLTTINILTMEIFLSNLPYKIIDRIFYFQSTFKSVFESSSFFLYDVNLKNQLTTLNNLWDKTLSYAQNFDVNNTGTSYHFKIKFDEFQNKEAEDDFYKLNEERQELQAVFKKLYEYLREQYYDIDIDALSDIALVKYEEYQSL